MIRSILAVCCFLLLGLPAHAAEDVDICAIAYDVARKDMGESGWQDYANKAATHYRTTWIDDNPSGNLKRYLEEVVSWEIVAHQYLQAYDYARNAKRRGRPVEFDLEF